MLKVFTNFRDKNVVLTNFRAKNAVFTQFRAKNVVFTYFLANTDFATKQRMFGLLIIDEGPLLSMTDGCPVAHFKLVCHDVVSVTVFKSFMYGESVVEIPPSATM